MVEVNKMNLDVKNPAEAFSVLICLVPEPGWCLLVGISFLALAYARVGFVEGGGLRTGRLLLLVLAALMLMLAAAALPLIALMPLPPPIENVTQLDEVAFLLAALAVLGCCCRLTWNRVAAQ